MVPMLKKSMLVGLLVTIGMTGLNGCVSVVSPTSSGTPATYSWFRLQVVLSEYHDAVYDAAIQAASQMQLSIIQDQNEFIKGKIIARNAQDKKIKLTTYKLSDNLTKLTIKVSAFGDQAQSQAIFQRIMTNLAADAGEPNPS